jgi:hypothetical protein
MSRRRLAFVGQGTYFRVCALEDATAAIEPRFIDFRAGGAAASLEAQLAEFDPDVVVVFRPEIVPAGLFAGLRARTIGFLTEPLPRVNGADPHPDLVMRLTELRDADASNFDRIVAFDPFVAASADTVTPVWRSLGLPVTDRLYADVRPATAPARFAFYGYWTPRRERFLIDAKHEFDLLHVDYGAEGERLRDLYASTSVAINVHNHDYLTFENRVPMHLAAGHLVVSEPLSPLHGLRPGVDFLQIRTPEQLTQTLRDLHRNPALHDQVRTHGRRTAELFRASRVYERLLGDLDRDLTAFGTARRGSS